MPNDYEILRDFRDPKNPRKNDPAEQKRAEDCLRENVPEARDPHFGPGAAVGARNGGVPGMTESNGIAIHDPRSKANIDLSAELFVDNMDKDKDRLVMRKVILSGGMESIEAKVITGNKEKPGNIIVSKSRPGNIFPEDAGTIRLQTESGVPPKVIGQPTPGAVSAAEAEKMGEEVTKAAGACLLKPLI